MNWMRIVRSGFLVTAVTAVPALMGQTAAPKPAKTGTDSSEASKLIRSLRFEAGQVRMHAHEMFTMSKNSSADWKAYDKQWNEIKPAVEELNMKISRLQSMHSSLSQEQQKAVDSSVTLVKEISSQTAAMHRFLNDHGKDLSGKTLRRHELAIARDAGQLVQTLKQA